MDPIKSSIKNIVKNRVGDGSHNVRSATYALWFGPITDIHGTITWVEGYDKITHTVYGCSKRALSMFKNGTYTSSDSTVISAAERIFKESGLQVLTEIYHRFTQSKTSTV